MVFQLMSEKNLSGHFIVCLLFNNGSKICVTFDKKQRVCLYERDVIKIAELFLVFLKSIV